MSVFIVFMMLLWAGIANAQYYQFSASGHVPPHKHSNAIDSIGDNQWTCRGECWFLIDRGETHPSSALFILWLNFWNRQAFFDIEVSADGEQWKTVFDGSSDDHDADDIFRYSWPEEPDVRYLRINGHGNNKTDHNSIQDVLDDAPQLRNFWTLRQIIEVTASSHNGNNVPDNTWDFDPLTHWTANNGEWIQYELEDEVTVRSLNISWLNGNRRKATYKIEVSLDGATWDLAFSGVSSGATKFVESSYFEDEHVARYVRITGLGNDGTPVANRNKNSMTEVEILGNVSPLPGDPLPEDGIGEGNRVP